MLLNNQNVQHVLLYGTIFYLTEFERKMKENTKKCNDYSHGFGEIIHKCNKSIRKQEFLFKHDKNWLKT